MMTSFKSSLVFLIASVISSFASAGTDSLGISDQPQQGPAFPAFPAFNDKCITFSETNPVTLEFSQCRVFANTSQYQTMAVFRAGQNADVQTPVTEDWCNSFCETLAVVPIHVSVPISSRAMEFEGHKIVTREEIARRQAEYETRRLNSHSTVAALPSFEETLYADINQTYANEKLRQLEAELLAQSRMSEFHVARAPELSGIRYEHQCVATPIFAPANRGYIGCEVRVITPEWNLTKGVSRSTEAGCRAFCEENTLVEVSLTELARNQSVGVPVEFSLQYIHTYFAPMYLHRLEARQILARQTPSIAHQPMVSFYRFVGQQLWNFEAHQLENPAMADLVGQFVNDSLYEAHQPVRQEEQSLVEGRDYRVVGKRELRANRKLLRDQPDFLDADPEKGWVCPICMESAASLLSNQDKDGNAKEPTDIVQIKCPSKHKFCSKCILEGYHWAKTCPICRGKVGRYSSRKQKQASSPTEDGESPVRLGNLGAYVNQ